MFQGVVRTQNALIVTLDNKVYNIPVDHPNFQRVLQAYQNKDENGFINACDTHLAVTTYVENENVKDSGITIQDGVVYYNGEILSNSVVNAIKRMISEGFDIKPMVKFLENLMENPSYNSIQSLWNFIEAAGLTITEDGCFLAHKAVRSDYTDKYSGKINNEPGQKPKRLNRSEVDDNPSHPCSHGYHVGALAYAGPNGWYHNSGDRTLICKVNPKDVVSVPTDHAYQKLRCCYYEPVGEFDGELKSSVYSGNVDDDYSQRVQKHDLDPEYVDEYNLLEDNFYVGYYTKSDDSCKLRHFLVDDINVDDSYTVLLVSPEECDCEFRTFRMDGLRDVRIWDGEIDSLDECDCDGCYW